MRVLRVPVCVLKSTPREPMRMRGPRGIACPSRSVASVALCCNVGCTRCTLLQRRLHPLHFVATQSAFTLRRNTRCTTVARRRRFVAPWAAGGEYWEYPMRVLRVPVWVLKSAPCRRFVAPWAAGGAGRLCVSAVDGDGSYRPWWSACALESGVCERAAGDILTAPSAVRSSCQPGIARTSRGQCATCSRRCTPHVSTPSTPREYSECPVSTQSIPRVRRVPSRKSQGHPAAHAIGSNRPSSDAATQLRRNGAPLQQTARNATVPAAQRRSVATMDRHPNGSSSAKLTRTPYEH